MPDDSDPLVVPVATPAGSLYFATIQPKGTVQDAIHALLRKDGVENEVLGDLSPYGWALQRIRKEHHGRQWEEEELESLGNGSATH